MWFLLFVCFVWFFFFSMEWHYTARKLTTVSASLAVISTASKHLHNDLAKAIEALEEKKISWKNDVLEVICLRCYLDSK